MAFLRVNRTTTGAPRDTDVNQYAKALSGEEDVGTLSLASPVAAPTSAGSGVASLGSELGVGTYTYAMTYVTGHKRSNGVIDPVVGETPAGPTWTVTTTAGNQRVSLSSLPVPANAVVVAKRLYRSAVGGGQRKLVATLATGLTAYVDVTPDANRGANEPTSNTTGSRFSFAAPTQSSDPATKGYVDTTFIELGTTNQSVELVKAILQPVDTRTTVLTYTSGKLTLVEEKDGASVVRSTTLNYTGDRLTSVVETASGTTVTTTLNYNGDGTVASTTRTVT